MALKTRIAQALLYLAQRDVSASTATRYYYKVYDWLFSPSQNNEVWRWLRRLKQNGSFETCAYARHPHSTRGAKEEQEQNGQRCGLFMLLSSETDNVLGTRNRGRSFPLWPARRLSILHMRIDSYERSKCSCSAR